MVLQPKAGDGDAGRPVSRAGDHQLAEACLKRTCICGTIEGGFAAKSWLPQVLAASHAGEVLTFTYALACCFAASLLDTVMPLPARLLTVQQRRAPRQGAAALEGAGKRQRAQTEALLAPGAPAFCEERPHPVANLAVGFGLCLH